MPGKRILLVDDEVMVGNSIKMILEMDGYDVAFRTSAAEALDAYQPGKFDVVITDHRMPQMTGLELAQRLKALDRTQAILMLTGFPPPEARAVVDRVILKPFSNRDLREAVRQLMNTDGSVAE